MIPSSLFVLHGGSVLEITLLEYAFRFVLHLFALGGLAAAVFGGFEVAGAIRASGGEKPDRTGNDP